jgi:hypothetical protein
MQPVQISTSSPFLCARTNTAISFSLLFCPQTLQTTVLFSLIFYPFVKNSAILAVKFLMRDDLRQFNKTCYNRPNLKEKTWTNTK